MSKNVVRNLSLLALTVASAVGLTLSLTHGGVSASERSTSAEVAALRAEMANLKARVGEAEVRGKHAEHESPLAVAQRAGAAKVRTPEPQLQLSERFAREPLDAQKTHAIRAQLDRALGAAGGAQVRELECRGVYCRASFDASHTAQGDSVASFVVGELAAREAVGGSVNMENDDPAKYVLTVALPRTEDAAE